jgi:hypothetical protein
MRKIESLKKEFVKKKGRQEEGREEHCHQMQMMLMINPSCVHAPAPTSSPSLTQNSVYSSPAPAQDFLNLES